MEIKRLHSLTGHSDCIYSVEVGSSADIFSAGADGMVVRWNLNSPETGELIAKLPNSIYALHHLPTTNRLIAAQNFEGIHLLDFVEKKELATLKLANAYIFDVKSWGGMLFVADSDGNVSIVDMDKWRVADVIRKSSKSARTLAINETSGELAVGYSDNHIRVFDLQTNKLKYQWQAHENSVFSVQFSPDGNFLLSGSRDAHLKAWETQNGYKEAHDIVAHMYTINHIAFSPDSKHFVTCSMDKSIKIWDSNEFRLLKVVDKARHAGHGTSVNKLAWTSFNNQLVSASDDRTLSIWEIIF